MKPEIYLFDFESKQNICDSFGVQHSELDDSAHVYLAYYHIGDYGCDSSAYVLFEKDGKLYEVHGGHCSCHGLDEESYNGGSTQWQPEEVTVEYLRHQMNHNGKDAHLYYCSGYDDEVEKSVNACKTVVDFLENNLNKG